MKTKDTFAEVKTAVTRRFDEMIATGVTPLVADYDRDAISAEVPDEEVDGEA